MINMKRMEEGRVPGYNNKTFPLDPEGKITSLYYRRGWCTFPIFQRRLFKST